MKRKQWLCLLLMLLTLLSAAGCGENEESSRKKDDTERFDDSWAETIEETPGDVFIYSYPSEGTILITGLRDKTLREIRTPETIDGYAVTGIDLRAFQGCEKLKYLVISEGVEFIGSEAFRSCEKLERILLPDSLEVISEYAFANCIRLECITIPKRTTFISNGILWGCTSLQRITVEKGNPIYCSVSGVLFDINGVNLYQYPAGNTRTDYTVPDGTVHIWEYAFASCANLSRVELPDSVESIGEGAFYGCDELRRIDIPDTVTYIGEEAFEECPRIEIRTPKDSYAGIWAEDRDIDVKYTKR